MSRCGLCRPPWMKLVDNIYPNSYLTRKPKVPNLNSLTYYSCRKPEKLEKVTNYVSDRLSRDMTRRRIGYVFVSMDIIDNLIKICQRWDSFIEIYLIMLTTVLESSDPELQILGTNSFEKFSQIDKETPNFLFAYKHLLKCFVAMSHSNCQPEETRQSVRCAGLQGIKGIVRKIATDDLQMNIWEKDNMTMIVSASLFNLEEGMPAAKNSNSGEISVADISLLNATDSCDSGKPFDTAKETLQELVMRANYNNMESIVESVLEHFDHNQNLWVPNEFALFVFETIISRTLKAPQAHTIVDCVIKKLNSSYPTTIKRSIVQVVSNIVGYAASDAIGPAVYNVYKELCHQLLSSIDRVFDADPIMSNSELESEYREEIIRAMVKFAEASHDTQKVEIMKYILSFEAQYNRIRTAASSSNFVNEDERRKKILMKALLKTITMVAENYKTCYLGDAFPFDFLPPLIKIAMNSDPGIRVYVQNILQYLIDRHGNKDVISRVCKIYPLGSLSDGSAGITLVEPTHHDLMFMKSAMGSELLNHLYAQIQEDSNRVDNYEKLYTTLSLLAIETACDDTVVELFRLGLQIQKFVASDDCPLKIVHKSASHALVAAFFNILCQLQPSVPIREHVMKVIGQREATAVHFLPKVAFNRSNTAKSYPTEVTTSEDIMFNEELISSCLSDAQFDISNMKQEFESLLDIKAKQGDNLSNRGDFRDYMQSSGARRDRRESAWSLALTESEFSSEMDPYAKIEEKDDETEDEDISFAALRKIMYEPAGERAKRRAEEDRVIQELYNTLTFEELVQRHRAEKSLTVNDTFNYINKLEQSPRYQQMYLQQEQAPTLNEIEFPSLFVF